MLLCGEVCGYKQGLCYCVERFVDGSKAYVIVWRGLWMLARPMLLCGEVCGCRHGLCYCVERFVYVSKAYVVVWSGLWM